LLAADLAADVSYPKGARQEAVFVPGMVTFVLLYGMSLSPVLGGDGVGAARRVMQVAVAAVYAIGAASLMLPLVTRFSQRRPA